MDCNYCLGLELDDPGFDHSVLSEFRKPMAEGGSGCRLLAIVTTSRRRACRSGASTAPGAKRECRQQVK